MGWVVGCLSDRGRRTIHLRGRDGGSPVLGEAWRIEDIESLWHPGGSKGEEGKEWMGGDRQMV